MPTLIWERRDGTRSVFQLSPGETTIGRDPASTIRIESEYISKRHAAIRAGQHGYTIADLGSSNGTSVNGQRVTAAPLKDGDRIDLGAEVLKFSVDGVANGAEIHRRPSPVMLAGIACGGLVVVVLFVRLMMTGSPSDEGREDRPVSNAPPTTVRPSEAGAQTGQPAAIGAPSAPELLQVPSASGAPSDPPPLAARPAGGTVPGADNTLPANDPTALYDLAMSHVKGGRLVEARNLLVASLRLDPKNASAAQRLREVDATIEVKVDRHLADGQRAFTYLRYQDAILEWEQALSMTDPGDPRHQQAAAGIQRARERLGR